MSLDKNGFIYRNSDEIFFNEEEINEEGYEKLFQITKNQNSEYILNFNKVEYDDTENISSLNNAWFLLKPQKMENNISKYKINEGDIIKIGRITIRITAIKNDKDNNDYYLNQKKNGNNISNNSINIINSNNNSRIINEIIDITNIKKNNNINNKNNKNLDSLRTGTNQTMIPTTKTSYKKILKEDKINIENKYEVNIINENENSEIKSLNNSENNNNEINNNNDINKRKYSKNKICRICYMEEDDLDSNPLLNPCICAGSMKYIHYNCLRHWIINKCYSKIETNNNNCSIFKIRPVECELCKTKFPDIITKNGNKYNISEFKPEYDNYLIFESLTLDKNKNKYNYIVALNENENKICIGRDKESNILFSDISVSRTHCILNIENNNIYINDNDSTFGTLILLQTSSINLSENLPLYIQIGRSFLKIVLKKNQFSFLCCNTSEKPNNKYYFTQNEKKIFYRKKITLLNLDDINNNENYNCLNENKNDKNESNINIKKIIIKKNDEKNNSQISKKDNMNNYLSNYYENTEKMNGIKDSSVNSRTLRKIRFNDGLIQQKKNQKENSIDINRDKNSINEEIKSDDLAHNNINDNSRSNQSKSIYIDEEI